MAASEADLAALATAVAEQMSALLAAAQAGDWAGLTRLDADQQALLNTWRRQLAAGATTPAAARPAIEAALADEAKLRALITAQLAALSGDLQSVGNRKRLLNAYGI